MKDPLQAAALAVSSARGDQIFQELTRYLATILGVQMALIGRVTDKHPRTIRTLGIYGGGAYQENIEYPLEVTPCRNVMGGGFSIVPRDVAAQYPEAQLPRTAVGYAGYPLVDGAGRAAGVIAVTTREPITDAAIFETVLKIFALRAAAELDRRAHEEALAASEANYRAIFEAAEEAIFLHDWETGAIVDVNPKARSAYGGVPPYSSEEGLRLIRELRESGGPLRLEWRRSGADGSLQWDEVTLKKVDIAGRPRVMAMCRPITDRKHAVEALKASEEQYRAIFNASADSLVLRDADFRVVDVNPAYEKMSGRSKAEALGRDTLTMSPPELTDYVRGLHARALAGETVMFEALARRKDGSRFNIETRGVPILHQGRPHVLYIGRDITARKSEEDLLRASEEQYRAIFDASADALVLWDSDMRRVDINAAYERIFGYSRAEVLDPSYADRVPAAYAERRRELVRRSLAGERCHAELETLRKDGTRIVVEVRTIPIQHRGRPHVLAVSRDITDRKRAEAAVRASEEQYRAIFNASVDGMLLWDSEHRIVDVNQAFVRMHGYSREELIGQQQPLFIPPELQAQCAALLPAILAGRPCRLETRSLRKDGTQFEVEVHGVPMEYQGRPHALVMLRDVTESRRAAAAIRASEERYRLLFEMDSDAILLVDAETLELIDMNPVAEKLWGYRREELLRMKATDLSAEPVETRAAVQQSVGTITIPLRWHRRKDGSVFPVEITANRFLLEGRRIVQAAIRDISERQRAEAERAQLESQLRQAQKMEAIGHLAGGIAHDFNNILQSILGNLTLAGERAEELQDARLGRYLERAQLSAQRARELIQQMLTFSRGKRGEPRVLALAPLVEEAVKLLRPTLPSSIELQLELPPTAPVRVDRVQAEQVLLNLCINARDAMRGQGTLAISIREFREPGVCASCRQRFAGRHVELAVRDSGPGIRADVAERMFEPFFSTKEVGKGSGMGLSVVHGIVHEHGGHILVDSAPGRGALFRVLLPAAGGAIDAQDSKPGRRAKPRLEGSVLVVDDEEMILDFMGDLLSGWGLDVTLKASGVEAKHAFAAEPQRYDLVLTDHTMPRMTGLELARQVRAIRPGTPVILYTGYGEDIAEAELAAAGVRTLAKKPVEPPELLALLATHLQQSRNTAK